MSNLVDIVHLTFKPPFLTGSYNRFVAAQIRGLPQFRQLAVSYHEGKAEDSALPEGSVLCVSAKQLTPFQRAWLSVPATCRSRFTNDIRDRRGTAFVWGAIAAIRRLKPGLVVCYDNYKAGHLLRRAITWPCRLILSQRGLSYYLSGALRDGPYVLDSFDVVWTQTLASYHTDRAQRSRYEPLVVVIPNGVDVGVFRPVSAAQRQQLRAAWGIPLERPVVLLLSRLVPKKGAHLIIHSWRRILKKVPDAFLWIVGGPSGTGDGYAQYLASMVRQLGLSESVRLQGPVIPERTAECYQAADLYVLPTLHSEGMANTLLEAMSSGLACVVSDEPSSRELYRPQEVVFVRDPNLEDAFVEPIVRLLENQQLREELGAAAAAGVRERYPLDRALTRLSEFYSRQLEIVRGCAHAPRQV